MNESDVYNTIQSYLQGVTVGYSHKGEGRHPVEILVKVPNNDLSLSSRTLSTPIPANALPGDRSVVELGDVVKLRKEQGSFPIFRHNSRNAEMVLAELAGQYEAPVYGMIEVAKAIDAHDWKDLPKPVISYAGQPSDESVSTLLWDGEWEVTYVDLPRYGRRFHRRTDWHLFSCGCPVWFVQAADCHLAASSLTLIGIMLGHWMFNASFTATSMIGFIALAGIIVRNSIFAGGLYTQRGLHGLRHARCAGAGGCYSLQAHPPHRSCGDDWGRRHFVRSNFSRAGDFPPVWSGFITLLTVLVIPAVYVIMRDDGREFGYTGEKVEADKVG